MLRSAVLVCSCYKENASYWETDIFGEARVSDSFYTLAKTLKEGIAHTMLNFPIGVAWKIVEIKLIIYLKKIN